MEYSSSYTIGGLLLNEFEILAPTLAEVSTESIPIDKLPLKTETSQKSVGGEIKRRLPAAEPGFWAFYLESDFYDRRLLLFYLCLKTYLLVRDFHFEVTLPNTRRLQWEIDPYDYEIYLARLKDQYPKVAAWTDATQKKTITNYLRMLREAGLLEKNTLRKPQLSPAMLHYFADPERIWFLDACFMTEQEKNNRLW